MIFDEFYNKIEGLLPYNDNQEQSFRIRLKKCLSKYESWVKELEIEGQQLDDELKDTIASICKKINDIVKSSMDGMPSKAFTQLHNLLHDKNGNKPTIDIKTTILSVNINKSFYRIRQMPSVNELSRKELFHIPITKRGMVKTQRYSSPGYPCLYLGESIYGCWEEMRRPPMHTCAVARFKNDQELNFIDMTIPSKDNLCKDSFLKLMPLVIACMVRVADDDATYKPEYIVPQLLIEWILKHRTYKNDTGSKKIHGVVYVSTHLNKEFDFPMRKFVNYAIPIFGGNHNNTYCHELCEIFSLTKSTTNDIEKLKGGYGVDCGHFDIDYIAQLEENYNHSDFGNLEERLNDEDKFPLEKINCKTK